MKAAYDYVVACERPSKVVALIDITWYRDNPLQFRYPLWIPNNSGDLVAAARQFAENARARISGRTNQANGRHPTSLLLWTSLDRNPLFTVGGGSQTCPYRSEGKAQCVIAPANAANFVQDSIF
jgi:hypothetical protein